MPDIVLCTRNARYTHTSFGLRYLFANLKELQDRAEILEFDLSASTLEIAETILARQPRILGLGVYIWNAPQMAELVSLLKRVAPRVILVLGGPEVSHETTGQSIVHEADYTICGEADLAFATLCRDILAGKRPLNKIIEAQPPRLEDLASPYPHYTDQDIAHRVVYVEASRGCPFTCEFCLSSLDIPVRNAPLDEFLNRMQELLDRGVKQFKFVDRTFNLNLHIGQSILRFFLDRMHLGLFLHFEMIPDRLPDSLRGLIQQFPEGSLQFEVGIQSFNPEVQTLISRRQNNEKTIDNLRWLRSSTTVHIHADLIVGLPGETLESFARGFDQLHWLGVQEIQVGILKRLKGTPIIRHDQEWNMVYSPQAPYEILSNKTIDFPSMCRMKRFARYWDLFANSGRFRSALSLLLGSESPFAEFQKWTDWIWNSTHQTHALSMSRQFELLFQFAQQTRPDQIEEFARALWSDYLRSGRNDRPDYLAPFDLPDPPQVSRRSRVGLERQSRHHEIPTGKV